MSSSLVDATKSEKPRFSIKEAIQFAWNKVKAHPKIFIFATLLTVIPTIVDSGPDFIHFILTFNAERYNMPPPPPLPLWFTISTIIISVILNGIFSTGIIKFSLRALDNNRVKPLDIFNVTKKEVVDYLIGSLLYTLIVIAGTILLIIPGIIWGIKYQLYSYLIIDKGMKPIEAIKKSGELTKGNKWNLYLFSLLLGLISLLGFLALILGLLIAVPVTWLAQAYVYRKLLMFNAAQVPPSPLPKP